jgi:hypothetical protein
MENLNKLKIVNTKDLDKSNVFILVDSNSWRTPNKISIQNLIDNIPTLRIEPSIVMLPIEPSIRIIHVEPSIIMIQSPLPEIKYDAPSVFSEPFTNQDIAINVLPKNASELSAMHLMADGNYLYVWVGNRWKRTLLSIWDNLQDVQI